MDARLISDGLGKVNDFYEHVLVTGEPDVMGWGMARTPVPTLSLVIVYLAMVKYLPLYMKHREAIKLKWTLVIYNMSMSLLNLYIAVQVLLTAHKLNYSYTCQPYEDIKGDPLRLELAAALWWFYASKLFEFCDTLFLILRKKNNQLSFLHVYHHSTMSFFMWMGLHWVPGGIAFFGAATNASVHVVMYLYYGLAAMGPDMQKYLWWKKYLTMLQLTQFLYGLCNMGVAFSAKCQYNPWVNRIFFPYLTSLVILFGIFYRQTYLKNMAAAAAKKRDLKDTAPFWTLSNGSNGILKVNTGATSNNNNNGFVKVSKELKYSISSMASSATTSMLLSNGVRAEARLRKP